MSASARFSFFLIALAGCSTASFYERQVFLRDGVVAKKARMPFRSGVSFVVKQGAFGSSSHNEPGNEYSWDLEVPFGTEVTAVDSGKVLDIYKPEPMLGECDPQFADRAWNVKIEHGDLTVAQYVHVTPTVKIGDSVKAGAVVAMTARSGNICYPHLHFGVYRSRGHLYTSGARETVPVLFEGAPEGILREGTAVTVE